MAEKIYIQPYDWKVHDEYVNDEQLSIHAWCMDKDSAPYLLRFDDFPAFCYMEFPLYVDRRIVRWDKPKAEEVVSRISQILKDDAPINTKDIFCFREKLIPL